MENGAHTLHTDSIAGCLSLAPRERCRVGQVDRYKRRKPASLLFSRIGFSVQATRGSSRLPRSSSFVSGDGVARDSVSWTDAFRQREEMTGKMTKGAGQQSKVLEHCIGTTLVFGRLALVGCWRGHTGGRPSVLDCLILLSRLGQKTTMARPRSTCLME